MSLNADSKHIRLSIPKGRMYTGIEKLLRDAGAPLSSTSRGYRPAIALSEFDVKVLKPRAILELLDAGDRDVGFAGADWVEESGLTPVELLDTGLDPVRLVAAAPAWMVPDGELPSRPLVVASEYVEIARRWIADRGLDARVLRSYGATEVLPPEDADCIIDNTATGSTLRANGLRIIDEVSNSSTRLYASRAALDDPEKRARIEELTLLIRSVLEARSRVMLEVNIDGARVEDLVSILPCMRQPTVAPMHESNGFAVKVAVPREQVAALIPKVKARGGTDIIISQPEQIVP